MICRNNVNAIIPIIKSNAKMIAKKIIENKILWILLWKQYLIYNFLFLIEKIKLINPMKNNNIA